MKNAKIIIAFLLAAVMIFSIAACTGSSETPDDNKNTTDKPTDKTTTTTKSFTVKVSSGDYVLKKPSDFNVATGTSYDDVIAQLPTSIGVLTQGTFTGESEVLFTETFDGDESELEETWDLFLPEHTLEDGKLAITAKSTTTKMAVAGEADWMKIGTEDYANYAVKAVVRGTADAPDNNFGIILRASEVTGSGPDSYEGLYVGIGNSSGIVCVGYAHNNWNSVEDVPIAYEANRDYTIEVLVHNDKFVVLLDGEKMGEYDAQGFVNGTVGIRTYNQVFEVSEFEVRSLGAEDFEQFDNGYADYVDHAVTWSCGDYDANTKGKYGFIGTIGDLGDDIQCKVVVTVKDIK